MNSLERIGATIKFQATDRTPVIAQVFAHAGTLAGVPVGDYVRDGETLARCQIEALNRYGYDAVFAVMDVNVETEAVGSTLDYRKNQYPIIEEYALTLESDWDALQTPDPEKAGRMPELLKSLRILRRELGNEVLIAGCIMGPLTLTTQLLGLETALLLAIDDPERFSKLMDFSTDVLIRFGEAQIEAGAHLPVIFDPASSPAVIPPQFFRELGVPCLQRVCQALSEAGAYANWLHVAGPASAILPYYPTAGVDIANIDYYVSAEDAKAQLPSTCVDGNIKSLSFVESTPSEIEAESINLLQAFHDRGGFILSSGCEIPPESLPENIAAMVNATRGQGV